MEKAATFDESQCGHCQSMGSRGRSCSVNPDVDCYEPRADIADRRLSLILGGHVAGKGAGLPPRAQNGGSGLFARERG